MLRLRLYLRQILQGVFRSSKPRSEVRNRAHHILFNRTDRHAQMAGNLNACHVFETIENEHCAHTFRQFLQSLDHMCKGFTAQKNTLG